MSGSKIKSLNAVAGIAGRLKAQGKKVVFTNGCFDILHYGHVKYLQDAKKKGDILIVALNSDNSVKKIKGEKRPITNQSDRARTIAALECVDLVLIFNQNTPLEIIKKIKPDLLIKGADWSKKSIIGADFVSAYGGKVATVKLVKNRSTTNLINKIVETFH